MNTLGPPKKILVVDNQPILRTFLARMLARDGHSVRTAEDGLTALDALRDSPPDLVFLDLVMPNISGDKLCRIIRSDPSLREIFVVILSAIAAEQLVEVSELGADACIAKGPFPQMARHVRAVLALAETGRPMDGEPLVLGIEEIQPREITRELLAIKRRTELILERMDEGILEVTADGRITFANAGAAAMTGRTEEDLLGSLLPDILSPSAGERVRDRLRRACDRREGQPGDLVTLADQRQVSMTVSPVRDEQGRAIVILNDLSDLKRSEEALRLERERLAAIVDGNPIPTLVLDRNRRVVLWNRASERLTGVGRDRVLASPLDPSVAFCGSHRPLLAHLALDPDDGNARAYFADKQLVKSDQIPEAMEAYDEIFLNGRPRHIYLVAARLRDSEGEVIGAVETMQDMTEKEQLQRQLYHAQRMQGLGTLAAGMAHEFNNILAAILGYTQLCALTAPAGGPLAGYLQEIERSCGRASALTRRMLTLARTQEGERVPLQINAVIQGAVELLRQGTPPEIRLETDLEEGLPRILGDSTQLEQVLFHLGLNARDAISREGVIRFAAHQVQLGEDFCRTHPWASPGRYVAVTVEDDGSGMPPKVLERAFEPFFTTKEPGKGTGLGLSIAYAIVKDHQGYILAESPGRGGASGGSCLTVYLRALGEEGGTTARSLPPPSPAPPSGDRILVVDDEPLLREVAAEILEPLGYRVSVAASAEEALTTLRAASQKREPFHLVILDLPQPLPQQEPSLRELMEAAPETRIVASLGEDGDEVGGVLGHRLAGVLRKPFGLPALVQAVRDALR